MESKFKNGALIKTSDGWTGKEIENMKKDISGLKKSVTDIQNNLSRLEQKVDDQSVNFKELHGLLMKLNDNVTQIRTSVFGNGSKSLEQRIIDVIDNKFDVYRAEFKRHQDRVDDDISEVDQGCKSEIDNIKIQLKLMWGIISAIILSIVTEGFKILRHLKF